MPGGSLTSFRPSQILKFIRPACCSLLFGLAAFTVGAQGQPPPLSVRAVTNDFEPYYGEDLPAFGPMALLTKEALAMYGRSLELEFMPWSRVLDEGKSGRCDLIIGVWKGDGREEWMAFSLPLAFNDIGFFKRSDDVRTFLDLEPEARAEVVVGTVAGYSNPEAFEGLGFSTEEVREDILNIRKLAAGRIDLVLIDRRLGEHLAAKSGLSGRIKWLSTVERVPLHLGIIKKAGYDWMSLYDDLNAAIGRLKAEGELDRVFRLAGIVP